MYLVVALYRAGYKPLNSASISAHIMSQALVPSGEYSSCSGYLIWLPV